MQVETLVVGHFSENCYLVWEEASGPAVVIDPGGQPERILEALRREELTLAQILITHAHFDHFLGAPALQRATGAPVYVHRLDRDGIVAPGRRYGLPLSYRPPEDVRAVEDGTRLTTGTMTFTYRHTPGHSRGACMIVCGDTIFSGDTLFAGDVGRVDLPGGDAEDMRRSLAQIAAWPDGGDVYPGHGEATTLAREQAENPYLQPPFNL
ncbi:MAG: MBL fold metallo-hydrolase [Oscillospiraceae bacterium]|jgi:glyoxylase-like metal-dependent hydrolase (beta-lactamase superfamily II)|nr:MBL fold metallo-hydrolase [Oscillospiraceae bacterium]